MVEGARPSEAAMARRERPAIKPREISSRSSTLSASHHQHQAKYQKDRDQKRHQSKAS
jgi:hypothetical protein